MSSTHPFLILVQLGLGLLGSQFASAAPSTPPAAPTASADLAKAIENTQERLQSGTQQLARLREEVDKERLPPAQKLTELEKQLIAMRKDYEGVARVLDTRNLDITNLRTELKVREDESAYISNLMDEFVRGFEAKLHASEVPRFKKQIEQAKQAPANPDLQVSEKFALQLAALRSSLTRAKDAIGGTRFAGTAVNQQGTVQGGQYALVGPFALFGSDDGSSVGLAIAQPGSPHPVIKTLSESFTKGISNILNTGRGLLPLDATNGGALKELLHKTSLIDIYKKGGPIMHPLLLVSLVALAVVIERIIFLAFEKARRRPQDVMALLESVEADDMPGALAVGQKTKDFVARSLAYALEHRERSISNALMLASSKELKRFTRGIPILDTSITVAPLLGLLGTVTGMMHSFSLIGGDLGAPGAITGGISEALIATAFGLVIAITAVLPFNYLNARIDESRHDLESAATRLELIMLQPGAGGAHASPMRLAAPAAGGGGVH